MIYIVDIDGTVADLNQRLPMLDKDKPDWKAFFAMCPDDKPIWPVISTIRDLDECGSFIYMVTGRSDEIKEPTKHWLFQYGVPFDDIYMRKEGDHRHDTIVKSELLDQLLKDHGITINDIAAVFEDRSSVVKMYRDRGLTVYQVAEGNY